MAAHALADMLADFAPRRQPFPSSVKGGRSPVENAVSKSAEPVDIDALLAEERLRTEESVTTRLLGEHDAALAAERERHAAEIAEINRSHGQEIGTRIESGLAEIETRLNKSVTDAVARILAPIIGEDIMKRSIDDLAATIGEAIGDADAIAIHVSGPMSLFSALAEKLGEKAKHLRHRETDAVDLTVDVEGSLLATRLADWQATVHEAMS